MHFSQLFSHRSDKNLMSALISTLSQILLFSFLSIFLSGSLCAQTTTTQTIERNLTRKIKSDVEFSFQFTSLIMRVGEQLDRDIARSKTRAEVEDFLELQDQQIEALLKSKVENYIKFYESNLPLPDAQKGAFNRFLNNIKWANLVDVFRSSFVGLSGFFKRKGVGAVLGMVMGQVMEYSVYFALYSLDLTQLIPISMAIPYGTILSFVPNVIERFKLKGRLIKLMGGKEAYRAYQLQMKVALEKIKMKNADQVLFPLKTPESSSARVVDAVILSKNTWWNSFMTKMGFNRDALNYASLNLFILMNNVDDDYIQWVKGSKVLDKYMKTALISEHLINLDDKDIALKFRTRFSENFTQLRRSNYWIALEQWTIDIMKAKTIDDIRVMMAKIPAGVEPQKILELWDGIILPHYSNSMPINYFSYRKLKEEITILKDLSYQSKAMTWNREFAEQFEKMIQKTFKLHLPECRHPEAVAVKLILRQ